MNPLIARTLLLFPLAATALRAQETQLINYQGRVTSGGINFEGSGQFKFAIVNADGTTSYWSNDVTSTAGREPADSITLKVTGGLYSVLLGDTSLPKMAAIPAGVLTNADIFLRVWFNDGTNGSQLQAPAQRLQLEGASTDADAWQQLLNGPQSRGGHARVWTGSELIIWGGRYAVDGTQRYLNEGARFNPAANTWTAVSTAGAPSMRSGHTSVWTGNEMIIWGGAYFDTDNRYLNNGGRYNPASNSWMPVSSVGAPAARVEPTAVWTGSEMIVWGGQGYGQNLNTGGRYKPAANSWTPLSSTNAPKARVSHTAVWTGSEMIVWGGYGGEDLNTGGRYNPAENSWTSMSLIGAPTGREYHTAVWTGTEMIVWGGYGDGDLNTGGRYNPAEDRWTAMDTSRAPAGRYLHDAVWTGTEMFVWGGSNSTGIFKEGGRYSPADDTWTPVTEEGAPALRVGSTAVWTGGEIIVWNSSGLGDTYSYTPNREPFRITRADIGSGNLTLSFPTLTGRSYTLWRSDTLTSGTWNNTGFPALTGTGTTLTFTIPAPTPGGRFFRVQADP